MADFKLSRDRDAWFVIRGYRYQIDLTILRWLRLDQSQELHLELGEDIDIVNKAVKNELKTFDRELEQIKHLDSPITLRSPSSKIALANAINHSLDNPELSLLFRFCTNSKATTERPSIFDDRKPGIAVWEDIRNNRITAPEENLRSLDFLSFLRTLEMPKDGIDKGSWNRFSDFLSNSSTEELIKFIKNFEWCLEQPGANDLPAKIINTLCDNKSIPSEHAKGMYHRLFLHVIQVLSQSGRKMLNASLLEQHLSLPELTENDKKALSFIKSELLAHSWRLDQLEATVDRHEVLINTVYDKVNSRYDNTKSVKLSTTISDVSLVLPPKVQLASYRIEAIEKIISDIESKHWVSLYGSMGSGKTQLATLLGANYKNVVYFPFRDLMPDEAKNLLHDLLSQRVGEGFQQRPLRDVLSQLDYGTVIILDDLPRIITGDRLSTLLVQLAEAVGDYDHTLVTLGHNPIPIEVFLPINDEDYTQNVVPRLTVKEIIELLINHGCPTEAATVGLAASVMAVSNGHPTLVVATLRLLQSNNWNFNTDFVFQNVISSSFDSLASNTTIRLLNTVEKEEHRELLYRLCVILGTFGDSELHAVAGVAPQISKAREAQVKLHGLWLEKQSENTSVVCPMIARFGAEELDGQVERDVANRLASLLFDSNTISPIDFTKAIRYLEIAEQYALLGVRLVFGLRSAIDLPATWKKIILNTSASSNLLDHTPVDISLLVRTQQIVIADALGISILVFVDEANKLLLLAKNENSYATVAYALQCGAIIAKTNFCEALRVCDLAMKLNVNLEVERGEGFSDDVSEKNTSDYQSVLPWFYVIEIKSCEDFEKWFDLVSNNATKKVFSYDLAPEGLKLALDRLWMLEHKKGTCDFGPILSLYDKASKFFRTNNLPLFESLVVRSQIVVYAEYLNDLPRAVQLSDSILCRGGQDDEVKFIINDIIGRQYLYAGDSHNAINSLSTACETGTRIFNGIHCRCLLELSRAIADKDPQFALQHCQSAVDTARKNPRSVSDFDMVSALSEATLVACSPKVDPCVMRVN